METYDEEEGVALLPRDDSSFVSTKNQQYTMISVSGRQGDIYFRRPHDATVVEPLEAFAPLHLRPIQKLFLSHQPTRIKSSPPFVPYCRFARNRSFGLYWITEFRHWWKWTRLIVRLAGLYAYTQDELKWMALLALNIEKRKGPKKALKMAKRMGQGGSMRPFLKDIQTFTRGVRIFVASWRWYEAAPCRHWEVGVEEYMAFIGNRVSRYYARDFVDWFGATIIIPLVIQLVDAGILEKKHWHADVVLVSLGVMRAIAPFLASFQGSRLGRALTYGAYHASEDRWTPTMRINDLNLTSPDCCEPDEVAPMGLNSELVELAKKIATALGKGSSGHSQMDHRTDKYLIDIGFHQIGAGSGGYAVYSYQRGHVTLLLHVTPHGPSIYDELPRYIVLERVKAQQTEWTWFNYVSYHMCNGPSPPTIDGYCFKGAFFSPYQFAAMKERYDEELEAYERACKRMCGAKESSDMLPPTDLVSLKAFLETGRTEKQKKKIRAREKELQRTVDALAQNISSKMKRGSGEGECHAPRGVILYFEGLDCAGKSSTGKLVLEALQRANYQVYYRQYNRPPTEEQLRHPWMDRFEKPPVPPNESGASYQSSEGVAVEKETSHCQDHQHTAVVWDRGPAGDFVYGSYATAFDSERSQRCKEFMDFDAECRAEGILFCKLLFVTDRDSIARTLGKRLAHKKIAQDLHAWLDASTGHRKGSINREGLDEIDNHIDPTDFVAFNSYHNNLKKFVNFAKHTDTSAASRWFNPWLVISTTKRHPARVQLLQRFTQQLDRFSTPLTAQPGFCARFCQYLGFRGSTHPADPHITSSLLNQDEDLRTFRKHIRLRLRAVIITMILLFLVHLYIIQSNDLSDGGGSR